MCSMLSIERRSAYSTQSSVYPGVLSVVERVCGTLVSLAGMSTRTYPVSISTDVAACTIMLVLRPFGVCWKK